MCPVNRKPSTFLTDKTRPFTAFPCRIAYKRLKALMIRPTFT